MSSVFMHKVLLYLTLTFFFFFFKKRTGFWGKDEIGEDCTLDEVSWYQCRSDALIFTVTHCGGINSYVIHQFIKFHIKVLTCSSHMKTNVYILSGQI